MRKLSKTLLSLLLIAAMLASFVVLPAAAEEPAAEQPTETAQAAETQADDAVKTNYELSIVMLDCGRKYFSVDSIKQIIDNASAAGFGYIMLGVGNDGMRFLLDDMSLAVNGTTYSSEKVAAAIKVGNKAYDASQTSYSYAPTTDELTQSEMDAVLAYAKEKGMGVIPMLNTPGHMDAILAAATSLTGTNCSYNGSVRTIDVTNNTAVTFTQELLKKYVAYFAGKGCQYFNMGADEYANDKYDSGSMGFGKLQNTGKYSYYVEYVNAVAALIKNAGMTPMAFNDGIYFANNTSSGTFDTDIVICYWSNGWNGYTPMPASDLASKGFKMVNTNGSYYWVLGKTDAQCSASKAKDFDIKSFPGSTINNPSGAMFCIWADYPGAETEASVISKTADTIAAFGATLPKIDDNKTVSDEATGVSVTAPGLTGITVAAVDKGTELDGKKVAGAWNIELTTENGSYTGSAAVKVPLDGNWTGCTITAGVMNEEPGKVDYGKDYDIKDGFLTFTAPHFSTVVVLAEEKQQEITVTVGGTYELPLAGNGTNETSKVLDDTYATVEVKHEYQEAKETLTKNDSLSGVTKVYISNDGKNFLSVSGNSLSNETTFADATEWTVEEYNNNEEYYLKSSNGDYLIASRTWSIFEGYTYSLGLNSTKPGRSDSNYRWEYTSNGFNNSSYNSYYIIHSSSETSGWDLSRSDSSTRGYAYTLVPTEEVNKTTITFTGKSEGSTQVEIDGVLYNINVVAVPTGAMTDTSLTLEYWITNSPVYDGTSPSTNHTKSITTTTTGANTDEGIAIEGIAPSPAYTFFDKTVTVYYWQAMRLDEDNKQTDASGDDETADGMTFTHVRYHAGAWQYKTLDGTWHYFLSTDQAVAYYLQKTKVTTEVDTYVKDWGYGTAGTTPNTSSGMGQVALTVAVVYPDGTVSPVEGNMYSNSTTIFNYWADRDIGIIAPK